MSRGPDAHTLLERALIAGASAAGCPVTIPSAEVQRWASATFVGARHLLSVSANASSTLDAWVAALPEAEFGLRGHLVADLTVLNMVRNGDAALVQLEILTVEDR